MEEIIKLSQKAYTPEAEVMEAMQPYLADFKAKDHIIHSRASDYLKKLGAQKLGFTQSLLAAYPIKSVAGSAIMTLAECLPRVPDNKTAYELINDKIKGTSWRPKHEGGVMLKGVEYALKTASMMGANRLVYEGLKKSFEVLGSEFVLAENIKDAVKKSRKIGLVSFDMLGEAARTSEQAKHYFESYLNAIETVDDVETQSVSVKLSALHPKYELLKYEQLQQELLPLVRELIKAAKAKNLMLVIDAEEQRRLDVSLMLFTTLYHEFQYYGLGLAVQAYGKRAIHVLKYLATLGQVPIPVRLVKGAYWDAEVKKAQELGLPDFPVFTSKQNTDISYYACAGYMLQNPSKFRPQFATHNLLTIAAIETVAGSANYEFQRLYGMGEDVYSAVERKCRVYAPVGEHEHLLSYLIRRLLENGSNSNFVNQLVGADHEKLLKSPFEEVQYSSVKSPSDIFGSRVNSKGYDLGNMADVEFLKNGIENAKYHPKTFITAHPEEMINKALAAFPTWSAKTVYERADVLEKIAASFEENQFVLLKALMQEAKKTLADSIAELREAIDFCRYYAQMAQKLMPAQKMPSVTGEENMLQLHGKGVFACISPWNFPLAIFTGQIVAALVTGNTVVAKPAEQTMNIADIAVKLMHDAGIPKDALQLVFGSGSAVGGKLTGNPNIAGVCFTGGTDTAKIIQGTLLANPAIIPFIAETGGLNGMFIDSTALLEQTADDIIQSAFGSAGQRCSALRVAFVQDEIADKLISLIKQSAAELEVGKQLSADLNEVIDEKAAKNILQHTHREPEGNICALKPVVMELKNMAELKKEVFGPVLHIIRFTDVEDVITQINSTGYGLTCGIQTRIEGRAKYIASRINAGNIYINRSTIGAVVESQPFGGRGLSGTGFKAGGPHYLLRFCDEKVITTNKTAIGGNFEIL